MANVTIIIPKDVLNMLDINNAVKKVVPITGAFLLAELFILANSSKNADNQALIPYSIWYQQIRAAKGLGLTPNFQYSSAMINSLSILNKSDNMFSIGVVGSDLNGMSNALKLYKVQNMKGKNYYLLKATTYLTNRTARFFEKKLMELFGV